MDGKFDILDVLGKRMGWLSQRQKVLAENIANADTPGYQPRDIKESTFRAMVERQSSGGSALAATHASHIGGTGPRKTDVKTDKQRETYETSPSGNRVVLEEQLIKIAQVQTDYQTMTNLYRKHMGMIRMAIRGGQ